VAYYFEPPCTRIATMSGITEKKLKKFCSADRNRCGKDTHGSFSDLEYGNPGKPDVVERYGAEIRVVANRPTGTVVLVPVDASGIRRRQRRVRAVPGQLDVGGGQVTSPATIQVRRQVVTLGHAVLVRQTTDVVSLVLAQVILAQVESAVNETSTTCWTHQWRQTIYGRRLPY